MEGLETRVGYMAISILQEELKQYIIKNPLDLDKIEVYKQYERYLKNGI